MCVSVAAISHPFEYLIYYTNTHTGILLVDNVLWKGKVPQLYGDSIYYVYVVYIVCVCVCVCVCMCVCVCVCVDNALWKGKVCVCVYDP